MPHYRLLAIDIDGTLVNSRDELSPATREALARAARAGGGSLTVVSPDNRDLRQLMGQIDRSIAVAPLQEGERWVDFGYWLGLFFIPLMLLFFRPGGAVALQS